MCLTPHNLKDNYLFLELISEGSYGEVFKVMDNSTGMFYAIKRIGLKWAQTNKHSIQLEIYTLQ